uniref:G_PROTEIN_RECEP_F1_2 domain-containing protein n=1 Tax=Panagrellus redivivus TaxID=6233 RepID=A0A7E4VIP0_PANRE
MDIFEDIMDFENGCVPLNEILKLVGDWTLRIDVQVAYALVYFLIFVVGICGNGLLIGTMLIRKRMTVANVFLINLAISDLLLCITALPITPVLAFFKNWLFGSAMCKLVPLCQAISVLISSYCLCLIAVDRYRSIVTPQRVPWTVREAQFFMVICWVGSVAISSPLFITQKLQILAYQNLTICGEFCGEYAWADTRVKFGYGICLFIIQYLFPAVIMAFCYWKILQKVRQDWIVNTGSALTEAQQAQTVERKRRVMYMLMLMVAMFMGSWMPLTVVNILRDIRPELLETQMYFKLLNVHAIAMTSIVSNPMLYFWMSKRHRRALKDDMFWLTNVRRQQHGLLEKFTPNPAMGVLYRKTMERNLLHRNLNPYRRGTLADPTCINRERALQEMHANCFLLVPLMPFCSTATQSTCTGTGSLVISKRNGR